ncbi:Adenylate and Guanylate cyclase catalytic domain containing protein [Tritrichomonas foetus]|uniref:Adenylate and Guanylate cyclase catalytic domain containing protein n=1 Tax=Tritrichomonas foetus TaxID=1144522 RepID=A0A1J4KLH1_9EUKA|nr:Adenylate and Guanylate cyclase catalytic domain containing protein [Tritrichomonas foetus]|eukprot:OHT12145.1 Adenylate and Guanylate cyclase catalytic domain containing protein [Tritrichomonas foetus]
MISGADQTTFGAASLGSVNLASRYEGLIEQSAYKKTRMALYQLVDYLSLESPSFFTLHTIVSIFRVLQFFGPSCCSNYHEIWETSEVMDKVWNIVSMLFYIVPGTIQHDYGPILIIVLSIITILFYACIAVCAYIFTRQAKLPHHIPSVLSIFISTYMYIYPPVVIMLSGVSIGKIIEHPEDDLNALNVIPIILTIILISIYMWFYKAVYSISITFKPDSLLTISSTKSVRFLYLVNLITFISGVGSHVNSMVSGPILCVELIVYVVALILFLSQGGYVSDFHAYTLSAASIIAIGMLIISIVSLYTHLALGEYIFVIILVVWVASYFIIQRAHKSRVISMAAMLDCIEDDNETLDVHAKTPRKLENLLITGYKLAHPSCISFNLPKLIVEKYPHNTNLWVLYARFVAIYPEETQRLAYISVGMITNKLKGSIAKNSEQQIQSIMRLRETNLLPDLKNKINKVGKQISATKHKIRYIWDMIIQGNISELEKIINNAYNTMEATEAEIQHLLNQYPNSRFVARVYARYLRDIVADQAKFKQWVNNVSQLQRGLNIFPDLAHELGIHAFPALPLKLEIPTQNVSLSQGVLTDDTLEPVENEDDQETKDGELRVSIRESINNLKIPSYHSAKIFRLVSFILLFLLPVIFAVVYLPIYLKNIMIPLNFMYYISSVRTRAFQMISVSLHYIYENLKPSKNPAFNNTVTFPFRKNTEMEGYDPPPVSLGGVLESKDQLDFIVNEMAKLLPQFKNLMQFKPQDETMDNVRHQIFGLNIDFTNVKNPVRLPGYSPNDTNDNNTYYPVEIIKKSVQDSIVSFIVNCRELLELKVIPEDALNMQYSSVPINNIAVVTDKLSDSMQIIINYVRYATSNTEIIYGFAVFVVVIPLYYAIGTAVIVQKISQDKMCIYKSLASLPKNIVSKVSDSFKVLKKEEDDEISHSSVCNIEEINKQEENVLKIFATSTGSQRSKTGDMFTIIIATVFNIGIHIALVAIFCTFMFSSNDKLIAATPHIDYITASYAYFLASQYNLFLLPSILNPYTKYTIYGFNITRAVSRALEWQEKSMLMFSAVRFGNETMQTRSFGSLGAEIMTKRDVSCNKVEPPGTYHEIYSCWPTESLISYSWNQVTNLIVNLLTNFEIFAGNDISISHLYHIEQVHIYDGFFNQVFENIIPIVVEILNSRVPFIIGICFGLLSLAFLIELIFFGSLISSENRQKYALKLLLHCPGHSVVSNLHITSLLSGEFSNGSIDSTSRDQAYYDILVKELPDSIIVLDLEGKVISANNANKRIFELNPDELRNTHISDMGKNFADENPFSNLFETKEKPNFEKTLVYMKNGDQKVHVEVSFTVVGDNCVLSSRDVTQNVMYNKLISDERAKSDQLLVSILPPKLVSRVQAEEKNISFAVQSVTITFIDIVSFTPWCGSLPAATVMKTLNMMFKEFDLLVSSHITMTKVKCIGDCYMAAGGIFAEINQPAQHARDVVEFGIGSIRAIEKLNKEINQNLQIRVGVNTGGPIVAGVLGTEKPTFEILGPTINMAQQMEHHGVPMFVHISRAVYELIYGGNFKVKERGEVEIKNGTVVTYLVCP